MNDEFINFDEPPMPNKLRELSVKLKKELEGIPMTEDEIIAWCEKEWAKLIEDIK
jgi:hypothetical protein